MTLLSSLFSKYKWIDWYKYIRHNTLSTNNLDKNILMLSGFNKNMNNKSKLKDLTSNILEDIEYNVSYHGLSIVLELFGLISISLSLYKIIRALFFSAQIYTKSILLILIFSIAIMSLWTFITLNRSLMIVKKFYNINVSMKDLFNDTIEIVILFYILEIAFISEILKYKVLTDYSSMISTLAILIIWPVIISINFSVKSGILEHYKICVIINILNKRINDQDVTYKLFLEDMNNSNDSNFKSVLSKYIDRQKLIINNNKQNRKLKYELNKNV